MFSLLAPRFLRKLLARTHGSSIKTRTKPSSLRMESLEDRTVPSATWNVTPSNYEADIAAAHSGDTIQFGPGTYTQNIVVTQSNLTLLGNSCNPSSVVIAPSTVTTPSQISGSVSSIGDAAIDIYGQNDVVRYVTVNGQNSPGNMWVGIRVIEGGSATITNNVVENITKAANSNSNIGIDIGVSQLGGTAGSGTGRVNFNTITGYAGAGVLVDGTGANAQVSSNTITGRGTGNSLTEFGIQVSNGAGANVQNNTISGNTYSSSAGSSAGIWFYAVSGKNEVAALNCVYGNSDGILVQDSTGSCSASIQIVNNTVTGNIGFAGIDVLASTYVLVDANLVANNLTSNGIALGDTSNVTVSSNDIHCNGTFGSNSSETDGIYDYAGTGDQIICNISYSNSGNGINLNYTTGDSVFNNETWSNSLSGIQDYAGTNDAIWLGDSVVNDSDGIFLDLTYGDTVVGNVLALNGGYGLHLVGATNTFIANNLVIANGQGSIYIDSSSSGTTLINNWTSSPPVNDGTAGASGTSHSLSCAFSDADNFIFGLCN